MAYEALISTDNDRKVAIQKSLFADKSQRAWGHCGTVIDMTPLQSKSCTGLFVNQTWFAGDCMFSQRAVDGNSHRHGEEHIKQTGDLLYIYRYLSGFSIGQTGDNSYGIHPGMIAVRDYAYPFQGIQLAGVTQGIFFPHAVMGYTAGDHPRLRLFAENSAFAQVVHAEFDAFFLQLGAGTDHLPADRVERFKNVLRLAIHGKGAKEDVRTQARTALKETICGFIERNMADLRFSTTSILRQFGVSRATLFRMFEMDGGVRNYINQRRLFRAVHQISINPLTRGEISKAASEWGFSSDANFNRAVRRAFGTSPNSLFESPIQAVDLPKNTRSQWHVHRERLMAIGRRECASA